MALLSPVASRSAARLAAARPGVGKQVGLRLDGAQGERPGQLRERHLPDDLGLEPIDADVGDDDGAVGERLASADDTDIAEEGLHRPFEIALHEEVELGDLVPVEAPLHRALDVRHLLGVEDHHQRALDLLGHHQLRRRDLDLAHAPRRPAGAGAAAAGLGTL
jgi:hypothetical protein